MKGKRGTDHAWSLIKYRHSNAIYAKCNCGFMYDCTQGCDDEYCENNSRKKIPNLYLLYCPSCGAKKLRYTVDIEKSDKNIRDVCITCNMGSFGDTFKEGK